MTITLPVALCVTYKHKTFFCMAFNSIDYTGCQRHVVLVVPTGVKLLFDYNKLIIESLITGRYLLEYKSNCNIKVYKEVNGTVES